MKLYIFNYVIVRCCTVRSNYLYIGLVQVKQSLYRPLTGPESSVRLKLQDF